MHIIFLRPKLVFQLFFLVIVSACEAITTTHGRLIEPAELDRLELGVTTQAETIAILGPPSFEGAFNSGRLYYNNQKMKKIRNMKIQHGGRISPNFDSNSRLLSLTFFRFLQKLYFLVLQIYIKNRGQQNLLHVMFIQTYLNMQG